MTRQIRHIGNGVPAMRSQRPEANVFATLDGVIARWRDPQLPASEPAAANVVPLKHRGDRGAAELAPEISIASADRPAPFSLRDSSRYLPVILLISVVLHAGLYALFTQEPTQMASIGEEAITVEIIVGANSAAGTTDVRAALEVQTTASPEAPPDTKETREQTRSEPERPVEPAPREVAAVPAGEPIAPVQRETPPEAKVDEVPPTPEARPEAKPQPSTPSPPTANSVGRGRMTGDVNYQGLVAARLARFKKYPPEARQRHEQGNAVVSFSIDPNGRVASVRVVRGTGFAALDQEVRSMVERASPFPPPPRGAAMGFSAPVSFHLN
jgi:protein TonB